MKKIWVIYDGRYHSDPDDASIAEVIDGSEKEARRALKNWPDDYVLVHENVVEESE